MRKKRLPFWFENTVDAFRQMEEDFHNMMARLWREPFEFKIPEMRFRFPREFIRTIHVKMYERNNDFILHAELPGFSKDEIKLKVTPTAVDISAEKKKVSIEKGKDFYKAERGMEAARRVFTLPEEVNTENVKAKFENGLLEIILPKKAEKKKEKEKVVKVE